MGYYNKEIYMVRNPDRERRYRRRKRSSEGDGKEKKAESEPDIVTHIVHIGTGEGKNFYTYARHTSGKITRRETRGVGGEQPYTLGLETLSEEDVQKLDELDHEWNDVEARNRHAYGLEES